MIRNDQMGAAAAIRSFCPVFADLENESSYEPSSGDPGILHVFSEVYGWIYRAQ